MSRHLWDFGDATPIASERAKTAPSQRCAVLTLSDRVAKTEKENLIILAKNDFSVCYSSKIEIKKRALGSTIIITWFIESYVSEINLRHIISSWSSSFITDPIIHRVHDTYSI